MTRLNVERLLKNDVIFSLREVEKSIILMVLGGISIVLVAGLTFEGEYLTGLTLEKILEFVGVLGENWMVGHHALFLHEIQIVFALTFIIEIFFIISRYMRGWKL